MSLKQAALDEAREDAKTKKASEEIARSRKIENLTQALKDYTELDVEYLGPRKYEWIKPATSQRDFNPQPAQVIERVLDTFQVDDIVVAYVMYNPISTHDTSKGFWLVQECVCGRFYTHPTHPGLILSYEPPGGSRWTERMSAPLDKRTATLTKSLKTALTYNRCSFCTNTSTDNCPTCHRPWSSTP